MENDVNVSKTQRKREMTALQDLGKALTEIPTEKLAALDLPETLRDAVLEIRRFGSNVARRRQLQYIGRLMREVDADAIRARLETVTERGAESVARLHRAERWRARLIEDDGAFAEFVDAHAGVDAQHLRNLIRNARREAQLDKPPRSFRALFQEIKRILDPTAEAG